MSCRECKSDYCGAQGMVNVILDNMSLETYPPCDHQTDDCECVELPEQLLEELVRRVKEEVVGPLTCNRKLGE